MLGRSSQRCWRRKGKKKSVVVIILNRPRVPVGEFAWCVGVGLRRELPFRLTQMRQQGRRLARHNDESAAAFQVGGRGVPTVEPGTAILDGCTSGSSPNRSRPMATGWYKDFGSSKLGGSNEYPKTVLTKGMTAFGKRVEQGEEGVRERLSPDGARGIRRLVAMMRCEVARRRPVD